MRQTRAESQAVYIAWTMGVEIEMNTGDEYWVFHESMAEIEERGLSINNYYVWMKAHDKYDTNDSKKHCRGLTFRIKPENSDA